MKIRCSFFFLYVVSFLPAQRIPSVDHPEAPILILESGVPYGKYTGEILKTEGFNEYIIDSLSNPAVTRDYLQKFNVVILIARDLTVKQSGTLSRYVRAGGGLIAIQPGKKLGRLLGVSNQDATIDDGYLTISGNQEISKGLLTQKLQVHGAINLCKLLRGQTLATFHKDRYTYLAVVVLEYGKGHTMSFMYNLPLHIIASRQGNDQSAGLEKDGIPGLRAADLFTDGWVDTTNNGINQADEHMRLLSHGIENMMHYSMPIPRLWYFPDTLKSLITLNNDGEDSPEADFQKQFNDVYDKGASMTLYVKELDLISKDQVQDWIRKGFEISGHPDDTRQAYNPDWYTMDTVYKSMNQRLYTRYGINGMHTVVNHWFVWCGRDASGKPDYSAQARIESIYGIELDGNYAHYDNNSTQGHFLGALGNNQGNFTGSGLIMKFADQSGNIIPVYQQLNNVYDQQYMEHRDQAGFYQCFKGLLDRSLDKEVYSFISIKAHNNEYFFSEKPLMNMLDYANVKKVPVWNQFQLLRFLKAKEAIRFEHINWNKQKLTFKINSPIACDASITFLIPYTFRENKIGHIRDFEYEQVFTKRHIKGFDYALVSFKPGRHHDFTVEYVPQ